MNVGIRTIREEDAAALQKCASDAQVARTSGILHPYPPDGAIQWIKKSLDRRKAGSEYTYSIFYDGEFVGTVSLRDVIVEKHSAELEFFVRSLFWNKGITTEASRQAIEIAFTELALVVLHARCLNINPASARVLEKNGFQEIGQTTDNGSNSGKFAGMIWRRFRLDKSD